jgi:hypothetical protein
LATSYPAALDTFTNPTSTDTLNSPSHSQQHSDANDAIEAIQAELGTDPAGSYATVKARLDDLPQGVLGAVTKTADQGSIGASETDLTSLSVTVNVPNNSRQIKITAGVSFLASGAERAELRIKEGATQFQMAREVVDTGLAIHVHTEVVLNPTAGNHTYKLAAISGTGAAFLTAKCSSTNPGYLIVEDIGST